MGRKKQERNNHVNKNKNKTYLYNLCIIIRGSFDTLWILRFIGHCLWWTIPTEERGCQSLCTGGTVTHHAMMI